ncbi:MAG: periplasmic heavy metal sensor [Chitinivibrionia bacterium]|jgi:Spy/CpxP family protein refolding chaperone|nr:periplasmic heavy metal sensor [Chitinivibrionia bacterium]
MKKILSFILILALTFTCFAQQQQQRRGGGENEGGQNRVRFIETLDLTPAQREAFVELRREFRAKDSDNFANLDKLRNELIDEAAKNVVDSAQISRIVSEIGNLHLALSVNMYQNIRKVKEILTEEQFQRFIEHRKSRINRNVARNRGESKQNQ